MSRLKVVVISWYAPDGMDAGELVRLGHITASFPNNAETAWLVVDANTVDERNMDAYLTPSVTGNGHRYRVGGSDYLRAGLRLSAIEAHRLPRDRKLRHWVARELDRLAPDVIWANQPFVWGLVPERWRDRTVIDTHNVNSTRLRRIAESGGWTPRGMVARMQSALTRSFERQYLAASARTVVVSAEDRAAFQSISNTPPRTVVIPNGVVLDEDATTCQRSDGEPARLLFLGSLGYSANIDALRRLASWLSEAQLSRQDVLVTVAGSGPESLAQQLCEGHESLCFVGRIDSVPNEMRVHHALIAPHGQGGGSRIKVLEAFGNRLPVIGTAVAMEGSGAEPSIHFDHIEDAGGLRAATTRLAHHASVEVRVENAWRLASTMQWKSLSEHAWAEVQDVFHEMQKRLETE